MNSRNIEKIVLVGLLSVLFSFSSNAQEERGNRERKGPPTYAQLLKDLDENEDGKLSKAEVKGPLKKQFDKIDLDEDGFITEEEFKKAPKPKQRERKG